MSVTFRFATPEELPAVARLIVHSFPHPSRTPEWWEEQLGRTVYDDGPEILWVGEEGGRVVAACQLHRLRQWVTGRALPVMGLGSVSIAPTHRRRGLAARLVATGLEAARARGEVASALFPFRISFYQKLGYGLAGEAHQYRVAPDCLPQDDEGRRVELVETASGRAEVRDLYDRWARSQTGQVARTERAWGQLLATPDRALLAYRGEHGAVEGYALVIYRTDLPPQERFLEVDEIAWLTPRARAGLYAWLGSLGDQWRQILLRALPEQRLGDRLSEPRLPWGAAPPWGLWFPSATLLRGPMFRLLDLPGAWALRAVDPSASFTLALDVQDGQLSGNAGAWRLRFQDGQVRVERGASPADLSLRLDVETLSRLYIGAISATTAVEAERAATDRPNGLAELDRALRVPQPWTFDRF